MTLLQSWTESLAIFKPQNLKLFVLVWLKTIVESYKSLFTSCWMVAGGYFLITFICGLLLDRYKGTGLLKLPSDQKYVAFGAWILFLFATIAFLWALFLVVRPSIARKNNTYVGHYKKKFFYFIVFIFLFFIFSILVGFLLGFGPIYINVPVTQYVAKVIELMYSTFAVCTFVFFTLFMIDSHGTLQDFFGSIKRALIMVVYNYPFCFIATLVLWQGLYTALQWLILKSIGALPLPEMITVYKDYSIVLSEHITSYLLLCALIIPLSFIVNFYIKRVHEQFTLYFKHNS